MWEGAHRERGQWPKSDPQSDAWWINRYQQGKNEFCTPCIFICKMRKGKSSLRYFSPLTLLFIFPSGNAPTHGMVSLFEVLTALISLTVICPYALSFKCPTNIQDLKVVHGWGQTTSIPLLERNAVTYLNEICCCGNSTSRKLSLEMIQNPV